MIELVTGYAGSGHISSADVGALIEGLVGDDGVYILPTKNGCSLSAYSTTQVKISSGDIVAEGRHFAIDDEVIELSDLTSTAVRYSICIKYVRNETSGKESCSFEALQGTSTADPTIPEASIETNAEVYFPIYSVIASTSGITKYKRFATPYTTGKRADDTLKKIRYEFDFSDSSGVFTVPAQDTVCYIVGFPCNDIPKGGVMIGYVATLNSGIYAYRVDVNAKYTVTFKNSYNYEIEGDRLYVSFCNPTNADVRMIGNTAKGFIDVFYLMSKDSYDLATSDANGYRSIS